MLNASSSYTSKAVFGCSGCGDTTTPATQTLTVKLSATSPCVDSIDKFTLNISGPTTISEVVTGSSYTNENMKSGSYNVRAGNAGIQYEGRGIYPTPITWDNTSFTLNEGGNYTLTGKVNYCEGSCCPDTTTKGKVKVNVNLTGVNWTSFTVKTPAGTFTKLSTELELSPGTYNFSPTGGIEFNVKEDGKNYSCSKSTGASNKYYCDPSASPSSLTVQAGKSYTVNINIPVEDQQETKPSTMTVTVTRNSQSLQPPSNFGEYYTFVATWDQGAVQPVKFDLSGNYYAALSGDTSGDGGATGTCEGATKRFSQSGSNIRFLYQKGAACKYNQTSPGGPYRFQLEDFKCRLIIGSESFKCNYSGTTTIDGVSVTVKNSGNAYDIGDR